MSQEPTTASEPKSEAVFIRRVLIVLALGGLAWALYQLSEIMLLVFGAILFAVVLQAIAQPIHRLTHIGERWALLVAGLGIIAVLSLTGFLFGSQISSQLQEVVQSLPAAAERFTKWLPVNSVSELMQGSSIGELLMNAFSWGTTVFGAVATLVVVIMAGIYIAISPALYRNGLIKLFPRPHQDRVAATMDDAGEALRLWLGGQLLAMGMVGLLIGVGLAILGVPSALAPGLIVTDLATGALFLNAALAYVLVALIMAGWGPDGAYAMIGGWRFLGQFIGYSMLIVMPITAVAMRAESLSAIPEGRNE
mgnify:CR=1 FL=1